VTPSKSGEHDLYNDYEERIRNLERDMAVHKNIVEQFQKTLDVQADVNDRFSDKLEKAIASVKDNRRELWGWVVAIISMFALLWDLATKFRKGP